MTHDHEHDYEKVEKLAGEIITSMAGNEWNRCEAMMLIQGIILTVMEASNFEKKYQTLLHLIDNVYRELERMEEESNANTHH